MPSEVYHMLGRALRPEATTSTQIKDLKRKIELWETVIESNKNYIAEETAKANDRISDNERYINEAKAEIRKLINT